MQKRLLSSSIFVVEDVYSAAECREWIAFSEAHIYATAPIAQVVIALDVRNSTRVVLDDAPRAAVIFERLAPHLPPDLFTASTSVCVLSIRDRAAVCPAQRWGFLSFAGGMESFHSYDLSQ
jgi:hypothetical protein